MRVWLQLVGILVVLGASGGTAAWMIANRPEVEPEPVVVAPPPVQVMEVEPAPFQRSVHARGEVTEREATTLKSEVAGRVVGLAPGLVAGGAFEEAEVLVELDRADYELALARARAGVEEARTALAREQAEAAVAREEFRDLGRGEPSPLALREPQLAEARARLAAAEADLARAELDLERTRITAPYTGRVRSRSVGLGQLVTRGDSLAEVFATDRVEVRLALPDGELAHLELPLGGGSFEGPGVLLSADFAGRRHTWQGRVVRMEAEVDRTSRMVTLVVEVRSPYAAAADGETEQAAPLLVGLFVEAVIEGHRDATAVRLPRRALADDASVWLVDGDVLRRRAVSVVWRHGDEVVVGGGLAAGERVVTSPLAVPVEGMRVRVVEGAGQ